MVACICRLLQPGYLRILLLLAIVGVATAAEAQTTGVITGSIKDAQQGVLPGVTLTLRNVETGVTRSGTSEPSGEYRFAGLLPGRYALKAELSGFAAIDVEDLTLTVGLQLRHDITMALQGVQESLTVTAQSPVVETSKSEVSGVVTQVQIASLPIADRQPVSLALLLPGTSQDSMRPRRANADVGAGQMRGATMFYVDGGMNWSGNAGEPRLDFPQTSIREFKVGVSQATAEFGGTTGGVVNIVTKSGTNTWSGEVLEFFRDKNLNQMNKFEQIAHDTVGSDKPAFRRNQFGGAFGGPIVHDRVHFFVAAERTNQDTAFIVNTGKPQFYGALEGAFPQTYRGNLLFARGDAQLTTNQSFFVRYGYMLETASCEGCGGQAAAFSSVGGGGLSRQERDSLVWGHTWIISTHALNEIRVQGPRTRFYAQLAPPGTKVWDGTQGDFSAGRYAGTTPVYTFPSLTWGSSADMFNVTRQSDVRDDFQVTGSRHSFKTGFAFLNIPSYEDVTAAPLGTWQFTTDQYFDGSAAAIAALRNPTQFTASFPRLTRTLTNNWWQLYAQDEWKPMSNLTLNLGIRYDLQAGAFNQNLDQSMYPRPLPYVDFKSRGDHNNVAPRLGFAWDATNDGKTVFRGGYGWYYMYIQLAALRAEITTLRQTSITIRNPTYPDPYGGRTPESFASTAPPNISIVANDLQNPVARTVNFGVAREIAPNIAIDIDGVYTHSLNLTMTANINTPVTPTGARPDPTWGRIVQTQSSGEAKYRALYIRLDKRYSNRWQALVSYTLLKSDSTAGVGTNGAVTDFYHPEYDFGPATADRRHSLVASGSVLLPGEVTLGAVWNIRSTMPFSALAGTDLNNDGAVTDYVPGTTSNQGNRDDGFLATVNAYRATLGRAPIPASNIDNNRYNSLNIRASKALQLGGHRRVELIGQLFNVLGIDNLLVQASGNQQTSNALSDSFGRILAAQNRRQAELAMRFIF